MFILLIYVVLSCYILLYVVSVVVVVVIYGGGVFAQNRCSAGYHGLTMGRGMIGGHAGRVRGGGCRLSAVCGSWTG